MDAGVLIAAERNERRFWSVWADLIALDVQAVVPAPILAQVWRGRRSQALVRVLLACEVEPLDSLMARAVGEACARAGTKDIADASVVVGAAIRGDDILTTDVADIRRLTVAVPIEGRIVDFSRL